MPVIYRKAPPVEYVYRVQQIPGGWGLFRTRVVMARKDRDASKMISVHVTEKDAESAGRALAAHEADDNGHASDDD